MGPRENYDLALRNYFLLLPGVFGQGDKGGKRGWKRRSSRLPKTAAAEAVLRIKILRSQGGSKSWLKVWGEPKLEGGEDERRDGVPRMLLYKSTQIQTDHETWRRKRGEECGNEKTSHQLGGGGWWQKGGDGTRRGGGGGGGTTNTNRTPGKRSGLWGQKKNTKQKEQ